MDLLPDDVILCLPGLSTRDMANLALCNRRLSAVMREALCQRGLEMSVRLAEAMLHGTEAWRQACGVVLRGTPRRFAQSAGPDLRPLPPMAHLRSLELYHCRLPAGAPFWATVFGACPALREVSVVCDFFMTNYAADVTHHMDLVTLGAPRLHRLDVEGSWLVLYPRWTLPDVDPAIAQAVRRVRDAPPVPSTTLQRYRAACQQVPLVIDSPALRTLEIVEPHASPLVASRMGPASKAACEELIWTAGWQTFDAAHLAGFSALRRATLQVDASLAPRLAKCLDTLAALPPGLEELRLVLDTSLMGWDDSTIEWGRPLAHLSQLQELHVEMAAPPANVGALLGLWMGAGGDALVMASALFANRVDVQFQHELEQLYEEEVDVDGEEVELVRDRWDAAARDIDASDLAAWLDHAAPRCVVEVHNVPQIKGLQHQRLMCSWD